MDLLLKQQLGTDVFPSALGFQVIAIPGHRAPAARLRATPTYFATMPGAALL
jgi:hypothetical protein